jgi:hypothetical protein
MELDCVIAGVSQDMSFGENVTTTFLLIRLPDGQHVRAAIDDMAAAAVVALSVAQNGQPTSAMRVNGVHAPVPPPATPPAPRGQAPASRDPDPEPAGSLVPTQEWHAETASLPKAAAAPFAEDAPRIFGGQDGGDEADPEYGEPAQAAPVHVPGSNIQKLRNGRIVVPAKTVPKTALGYPITSAGGLDPETLTSSENKNDDGVGSV